MQDDKKVDVISIQAAKRGTGTLITVEVEADAAHRFLERFSNGELADLGITNVHLEPTRSVPQSFAERVPSPLKPPTGRNPS